MSAKIKSIHLQTRFDDEVLIERLTLELKTKSIENLVDIVLDKHWIIGVRSGHCTNPVSLKIGHCESVRIRNDKSEFVRQYDEAQEVEDGPRKVSLIKSVEDKYAEYLYRSIVTILWEMGISKPSDSWNKMSLYNSCRTIATSYLEHGELRCKIETTAQGIVVSTMPQKIGSLDRRKWIEDTSENNSTETSLVGDDLFEGESMNEFVDFLNKNENDVDDLMNHINDRISKFFNEEKKPIPFDYKTGKFKYRRDDDQKEVNAIEEAIGEMSKVLKNISNLNQSHAADDEDSSDDNPNTYTILRFIPTLVEVVSKLLYEGGHTLRTYEEKERKHGEFKDEEFSQCIEEFLKNDEGVTETLSVMIKALLHTYEAEKGPMDEESIFSRYLELNSDLMLWNHLEYLKAFTRRMRSEIVKHQGGRRTKVRECVYRYCAHVIAHTLSLKKVANDIRNALEELPPDRTIIEI